MKQKYFSNRLLVLENAVCWGQQRNTVGIAFRVGKSLPKFLFSDYKDRTCTTKGIPTIPLTANA